MIQKIGFCLWAGLFLAVSAYAQDQPADAGSEGVVDKAIHFPSRLFSKIQHKTAVLNQQLTQQTEAYLQQMQRAEQKMSARLATTDTVAAKQLFGNTQARYVLLGQRLKADTGSREVTFNGTYKPYLDSLQGSLAFLQKNPQLLGEAAAQLSAVQGASVQLQVFQGRLGDADAAKAFVQQRRQLIAQYMGMHPNVQALLGKVFSGMGRQTYYYSQRLRQYQEQWSNPDALQQKALARLNQLPAFQTFMKDNSQLGGLLKLPGSYGTAQAVSGLQTKEQVAKMVQGQVSAGGSGSSGGTSALEGKLQSAESQLDTYKSKLSQLGAGNGDAEMPDFKPNDQKTKTFLGRLQYGINFQTTQTSYYIPAMATFGLSLGYQLGHGNVAGIGASYEMGCGNGIRDVHFSSQGLGLRSFVNIKIKGSFFASGGFEYNYTTPFSSFQNLKQLEYWTRSGLIGVTKTISMKNRFFKNTTVSLLWDFLSYQQVPKTQPVLFRIGYTL
jgi:hypothetical protein